MSAVQIKYSPMAKGLGVALAWWCLAAGFGVMNSKAGTVGCCKLEGTCKGANQKGPPQSAVAPVVEVGATSGPTDTSIMQSGRPMDETGPGNELSKYAIWPEGNGFKGMNPAQGLLINFRSDGFDLSVRSNANSSTGRSSMTLLGIGTGEGEWQADESAKAFKEHNKLRWDHGHFLMVYTNTPRGMRHDLVVAARPKGKGRLEARFRLSGSLQAWQPTPGEVVFHQLEVGTGSLAPVIRYNGLQAWDAEGRVLPSSMELHGDELVLAVMDAAAVYPVTIDPLSSTADLEVTGSQAGEGYGSSVATAGDVNGDGYSDILVGSPGWGTPAANAGRVQLFLGSPSGISPTAAWTYQGPLANTRLGYSVSTAGDLNGDGYSDVAIGAPGWLERGAVLLITGASGGLGAAAAHVLDGDLQPGCEFGWSVALAGDVNGDGLSDIAVGAPKYFNTLSAQGKAYCYMGGTLALGWSVSGTTSNGQFGYSVAGAGDMDGDGFSDVVVGAPFQTTFPGTNRGSIRIYRGAGTGLSTSASSTRWGVGSANFGYSVASAGDMNGDGYADLIVGAPGTAGSNGAVHLFLGTGSSSLVPASASSSLSGTSAERMGQSVAMAGDVNGDGYGDVVIGCPVHSSGRGRARAYLGGPLPVLDATHLYWTTSGNLANVHAGSSVATGGDVNGDGISDLLIAAPDQGGTGAVRIYHGSPDMAEDVASWSVQGTANYQELGTCVASAGDVNGDGYSDVLVGVPGSTALIGEVQLFLGSAGGLPSIPSWTKQGEDVGDGFGQSVASAGDVNGDGYSDVLVGAPRWPNAGINWQGKAYLFLGSAGGLVSAAAWSKTGPAAESRFGYSLAGAGDVNGDGYSDVIIGAYTLDNPPGTGNGAAYVFHGSASGLPATANWTVLSQQHNPSSTSNFGSSVATAGDVNGDGYDEVIIGDHFFEHAMDSGNNRGGAFVFHGSATGLSALPDWSAYGVQEGDEFGNSVSYAGDVNGDGYSDVVIGAYFAGANAEGLAYVFLGSPTAGLGSSPSWSSVGVLGSDHLGCSVCSAGDLNGDGYGDILVGAYKKDWFYVDGGGAEAFLGSASGVGAASAWSVVGDALGEEHGSSVALAGDVNGDGYSDIVLGAGKMDAGSVINSGGAFLYLGNEGRPMACPTYQYRSDLVTPVRTSNGTFQNDCQWGIGHWSRTSLGRTKVKLVWQVEGHGPAVPTYPFDNNSAAYTGEQAGWTDSGLSGVLLKSLLSTVAGTTSHPGWRARVRHHPATALDGRVFGRWFMQGVHDLQVPSIKTELAGCGALPVSMMGSSVKCEDGQAVLAWTTATEQDCAEFIVQRTSDASVWHGIGRVPCSGNSAFPLQYRFVDLRMPDQGVQYYRLVQVDINGDAELFPAMPVEPCEHMDGGISVWPNPMAEVLHVRCSVVHKELDEPSMVVRDMTGRVIGRQKLKREEGMNGYTSDCSQWPQGTYVIEVISPVAGSLGQVVVIRL